MTEERATYVRDYKARNPMAGYGELIDACRKRFSCGIGSAQRALKRYRERVDEVRLNADGQAHQIVIAALTRNIERADERGELSEVRKTAVEIAKLAALYEPQEVIVRRDTAADPVDDDDLSDEELALMRKLKKR